MTKTLTAIAAAATLGAAAIATPTTAEARCIGCWVGAGVLGGLAAGAIIGSAAAYGPYGPYGPYYAYGPSPYYGPACWWQRQRVWDGYGWRYTRVRVCR
jgi:hypothetical protein